MNIFLTAAQVVEIAQRDGNAPEFLPRTVQYWTAEGLLLPTNPDSARHRRYVLSEAVIARACARWFTLGVRSPALKPFADELRKILVAAPRVANAFDGKADNAASDRYVEARKALDAAQQENGFALLAYGGPETSVPLWEVVTRQTKVPQHHGWSNALILNWHSLMRSV